MCNGDSNVSVIKSSKLQAQNLQWCRDDTVAVALETAVAAQQKVTEMAIWRPKKNSIMQQSACGISRQRQKSS